MEQMQRDSTKSVILPHKHRINNVPGRKASFSQHTVGLFSMSSLQTHERRHWWASNVTQTHLEKCERKRRKIETKITEKYKLFSCKLQCIFHVWQMVLESEWISVDFFFFFFFDSQVDLLLPGFSPITKHTTSIKNRCFIIMGHTVIINASLITGIKTCL